MLSYLVRRMAVFAATLLCASIIIFLALEVLPGNVAQSISGPDADPQSVTALARELGLDRPALTRYGDWLSGLARGDLGNSYVYGTPVADLVADRLEVTVPLAVLAMCLTVLCSLAAGLFAARYQGRAGDRVVMLFSGLGMAIPSFWFAIMLVLVFAVRLPWFAASGFPGWTNDQGGGVLAALQALLLPAVALAAVQSAILARFTRSALIETMHEDFVRTIRAQGFSQRTVLWRHVLRNAAVPLLTVAGLQFANLLAGTIVIENVFTLPGLGRLIFQSIANRDLIVIRNALLLLVAFVMMVNLVVDLLCAANDPRLREGNRN